jgi:DNA repair protein RadC
MPESAGLIHPAAWSSLPPVRTPADALAVAHQILQAPTLEWWTVLCLNEEGRVIGTHTLYQGQSCRPPDVPHFTPLLPLTRAANEVVSVYYHPHVWREPTLLGAIIFAQFVDWCKAEDVPLSTHFAADIDGIKGSLGRLGG